MVDQSIMFFAVNLNKPIDPVQCERYDLALSLEVAEHLEESSARSFVESLTNLSDAIMFGAAYPHQGGMNHINEQPHTYWAYLFKERNYMPFDLFRPVLWGDTEVSFWYQQNTFLYLREDCAMVKTLADRGYEPLGNLLFMNCVHPDLYDEKISQAGVKSMLNRVAVMAIPDALAPLARKVKKKFIA